jgi:hypothetical protein
MSTIGLAFGIYLCLMVLGWGLSSFALPRALKQYQVWLAPWVGLMLAAILGVLLSRLGIGAALAVYPITAVGAGLTAWTLLARGRRLTARSDLGWAFAVAFLVTLFLALYPLLKLGQGPTTVSLGNNDPIVYAATARFLEQGSLRHAPLCETRQPLACLVASEILPSSRPGTFLLIAIMARFFHAATFQILTVMLAVVLATTPPLAAIFARIASASRFAALLTLVISAVNVNLLYFFYHGFAGQVLAEGCLIIAFILLWRVEADHRDRIFYAAMLGLTICALLEIYQEDVPLFLVPYLIYAGVRLLRSKTARWQLAGRFALPIGIAAALDPAAPWYCLINLQGRVTSVAGWPMPRWALGADMLGFMNVYLTGEGERAAAIASVPLLLIALWGFARWRNSWLTLTVTSFTIAFLLYLGAIRDFSYGYHKLAGILSFLLVAAFATGITRAISQLTGRQVRILTQRAALLVAGVMCLLVTAPLVGEMRRTQLSVSPDLIELSDARRIAGDRPILFTETRWWQQLWGTYFLYPAATLLTTPSGYFDMPAGKLPGSRDALRMIVGSGVVSTTTASYYRLSMPADWQTSAADEITLRKVAIPAARGPLWHNASYALLGVSFEEGLDEQQVPLLRVKGQGRRELILDLPGDWARLRPNLILSGSTNNPKEPGPNPSIHVQLRINHQPPQGIGAALKTSGGRYALLIRLSPSQFPTAKFIQVRVRIIAPPKFGSSTQSSSPLMTGPPEVSLSTTGGH